MPYGSSSEAAYWDRIEEDMGATTNVDVRRANDLRDEEDQRVVTTANAFRQCRQNRPYDEWEWSVCSQDDVDRARELVYAIDCLTQEAQRQAAG
jgi:hypothetical protein